MMRFFTKVGAAICKPICAFADLAFFAVTGTRHRVRSSEVGRRVAIGLGVLVDSRRWCVRATGWRANTPPHRAISAEWTFTSCGDRLAECRRSAVPECIVYLAGAPQMMQQHRKFPGNGNHRSLLGVLAAPLHQPLTIATKIGIHAEGAHTALFQ
jgi:hypothetical protein